ncbi:hypothetical protein [Jatrophihabitans lederbergiae]|uniref:Uncharacterized protein n=1 Tax=Jatrophihabitans lederbergiae TaxID=3075547 RepID=A0ABU2JB04_9ACTN|nr:hypothetical protein [Jatrophihabitans sp. DSM 44399]MDT0262173.1 hypothetical protein [Jatrophihabitans sp. DSM 44399]
MTINKVTGGATRGGVDIVDHRMPAGYVPPMHVHSDSDEVCYIIDALYRRYPTRDALLDALTRRSFELVLRCARDAESLDVSGLNCLDHFLDAILSHRTELVLPLHGGPAPLRARPKRCGLRFTSRCSTCSSVDNATAASATTRPRLTSSSSVR